MLGDELSKDCPAAEGLSLPGALTRGWWSEGSYSSEAMWAIRPTSSTIAKFIVIPRNEFYKVVIESNASPSVKDGRVGVKGAGDNLILTSPGCP